MVKTAIRASGLALIAGALCVGGALLVVSLRHQGLSSPVVDTILLAGAILLTLGWPGMYARQAGVAGWLGLAGYALLQVGNVLLIVAAAQPLFTPSIKGLGESAAAFFLAVSLLLGLILTAVATLRAAIFPRWSGILLLAASAGFLFSFFVAEDLPPIAGPLSGGVLGLLLACAFGGIGISLWQGANQPAAQTSAPPATSPFGA
jgi:hypothetical protein